jgi:hypothetical protein
MHDLFSRKNEMIKVFVYLDVNLYECITILLEKVKENGDIV